MANDDVKQINKLEERLNDLDKNVRNLSKTKMQGIAGDMTEFERGIDAYTTKMKNYSSEIARLKQLMQDGKRTEEEWSALHQETLRLQKLANEAGAEASRREAARLQYLRNSVSMKDKLAIAEENEVKRAQRINQLNAERKATGMSDDEYNSRMQGIQNDYTNSMQQLGPLIGKFAGSEIGQKMGVLASKFANPVVQELVALGNKLGNAIYSTNGKMIEGVADIYSSMGKTEARLYGSDRSFMGILDNINTTVGVSGLATQRSVLQNIQSLIHEGVLFNVEQRGLLMTLQDSLVETFEVNNKNLERLIRIQQEDSTEAYMGAESLLTQFLNQNYKDTSYLSDQYDSVYAAITDALAVQSDADQSTQFNFNMQKWLSALYSVGMSQNAVSSIASAINSLATGELDASSQNLLALTTQKTGTSLASYLTTGVNGNDVNKIMESMVSYLKTIAENSDSNVIRNQFGKLFNLGVADWKAIENLSTTDIGTLANYTINQATAVQETEKLLYQTIQDRTHLSTKMNNVYENATFAYGTSIVSDESAYASYMGDKFIRNALSNISSTIGDSLITKIFETVGNAITLPRELALMTKGLSGIFSAIGGTTWDGNSITDGNAIGVVGSLLKNGIIGSVMRGVSESAAIGSFDMQTSMRGGVTMSSEQYEGLTSRLSSSITTSIRGGFEDMSDDIVTNIQSSSSEQEAYTLEQNKDAKSATSQNIQNNEKTLVRDINDLYAALFENTNNPLRIAVASYEPAAISQLESVFSTHVDAFSQPWS